MNLIEYDINRKIKDISLKAIIRLNDDTYYDLYSKMSASEIYANIKGIRNYGGGHDSFRIDGDKLKFSDNLLKIFLYTNFIKVQTLLYAEYMNKTIMYYQRGIFYGGVRLEEVIEEQRGIENFKQLIENDKESVKRCGRSLDPYVKEVTCKTENLRLKHRMNTLVSMEEKFKDLIIKRNIPIIEFRKKVILWRYICASWSLS